MAAACPRVSFGVLSIVAVIFGIVLPAVQAQGPAPAPTSDGELHLTMFISPIVLFLVNFANVVILFAQIWLSLCLFC